MKKVFGFLVLMLLPLIAHSGTGLIYFGPEAFDRSSGPPDVNNENFTSPAGAAYLAVFNGDDEQDSRVSAATIIINGTTILTPNDLNQQVDKVIKGVALLSNNTMQITIDGDPGSYITVMV